MSVYEQAVREALKEGPGSVKQIVARIPRASENGVRKTIHKLEACGEARIIRYEKLSNYAYAAIWEVIE